MFPNRKSLMILRFMGKSVTAALSEEEEKENVGLGRRRRKQNG